MAGVRDDSKEETPIHGARAGSGGCGCGCAWGERRREEAWGGTELREPVGAERAENEPVATPEPQRVVAPEPPRVVVSEPPRVATPEPPRVAAPEPQPVVAPEPQRMATPEPQRVATPEPQCMATPEPQRVAAPEPQQQVTPEARSRRVTARRYTPSQKAEVLEHAAAHGVSEAAEKYGVSRFSIYDWKRLTTRAAKGEGFSSGLNLIHFLRQNRRTDPPGSR